MHTGVAVIGKAALGHVHDATEIVGDTPNIAFRLQEIGEPNSLVISGDTQRLLKGKFELRPLGVRALKGLSRKMQAFQVLGEVMEDHIAHREHQRNASPMVGRSAEIDQLLQTWEFVKAGRGHTVEITGEAGIGKSRLALELIDKIGLHEDSIVALQASAHHQNTPLYPIIRRLEQRIGIRKDECVEVNTARLREFLEGMPCGDEQYVLIGRLLGLPMPGQAAAAVPDAQELRRKTRDAVVQLLTLHGRGGAGLVLVEDLHWADPSTVEVVERIVGQIVNQPILLLTTSRTDSIRIGSAMIRRIPLQRLTEDDSRDLAGSVVREPAAAEPAARADRQALGWCAAVRGRAGRSGPRDRPSRFRCQRGRGNRRARRAISAIRLVDASSRAARRRQGDRSARVGDRAQFFASTSGFGCDRAWHCARTRSWAAARGRADQARARATRRSIPSSMRWCGT